ncbi:hypothetical protein ACVWY3_005959 [Bradyrhizobium sp. USDA 4486]
MARHVCHPRLRLVALGDVLIGDDPAAMLHPLVVELDDAAVAQMAVQRVLALAQPLDIIGIELGRGRIRMDAEIAAVLHDLAHRDAGLHHVGGEAVHLDIAAVAHDDTQAGIEHAQALAHVVQRRVEAAILLAQLLDRTLALGDVLVGGDEAALGQRAIAHRDHGVVRHAPAHRRGVAAGDPGAGRFEDLLRAVFRGERAVHHRSFDQLAEMRAGPGLLRRQPIDGAVSVVADAQAHVAVVEGESVRHVLQGRIEHEILLPQRLLVLQPLGDVLVHGDPAAVGEKARDGLHHPSVIAHHQQGLCLPAAHVLKAGLVEFVGRHARQVAAREPVVDGRAMRDTRFHDVGIEIVEVQETFVANHDAAVGIIHDQAVRHVGERVLATLGLHAQLCFEPGEAADIVADRHPAAAGERLQLERHDKATRKPLLGPERLARCDLGNPRRIECVELVLGKVAAARAVRKHLAVARAHPHDVGRHVEQAEVALIDQHDPVVGVVDADALLHVVERKLAQRNQRLRALLAACTKLVVAGRRHGIGGISAGNRLNAAQFGRRG